MIALGLTNSQYDQLMRSYSRDRAYQVRLLEERRTLIYKKIPELKTLDGEVASSAVASAISRLEGREDEAVRSQTSMHESMDRRRTLLAENGFKPEDLELQYTCSDCHDTGYIGDRKCHCFRQKAVDLFYTQSGIRSALEKENFGTFSFEWYDDTRLNPATGLSARQNMHRVVRACRDFIRNFDERRDNLLFYGGTGLGKTFLSNCIARELIESAHSVIYYSSLDLFDALSDKAFGNAQTQDPFTEYLMDCDLLIIDDLGTEVTNSFVSARLFYLLNQRITRGKSMIISTNLSLSEFANVYSERIFSRISSSFILLGFYGDDIRILKKISERP